MELGVWEILKVPLDIFKVEMQKFVAPYYEALFVVILIVIVGIVVSAITGRSRLVYEVTRLVASFAFIVIILKSVGINLI